MSQSYEIDVVFSVRQKITVLAESIKGAEENAISKIMLSNSDFVSGSAQILNCVEMETA